MRSFLKFNEYYEKYSRPANKILAALPYEEFEHLQPKLRDVTFREEYDGAFKK